MSFRFLLAIIMLLNLVIKLSIYGHCMWSVIRRNFPSADSAASRFFFVTLFMLGVSFMNWVRIVVLISYRGMVANSFCIGICPNWWNI